MQFKKYAILCSLIGLTLVANITLAANPSNAACGLPAGGTLDTTATFTLSANCTQTSDLSINSGVTITINGGGYTINGAAGNAHTSAIIVVKSGGTLNLNGVTLAGHDAEDSTSLVSTAGSFSASGSSFHFSGDRAVEVSGGTATLSDVYFKDNHASDYTSGSAVHVSGGTVTITQASFEAGLYGGAAIVRSGGSVTLSGCISFIGNIPANTGGTITDNRTGACSGSIGNDDTVPTGATASSCGLPPGDYLHNSANYNLASNCILSEDLYISPNVSITVVGNGRSISAKNNTQRGIRIPIGSTLTLDGVTLDNVIVENYGGTLSASSSSFINSEDLSSIYNYGTANISFSSFKNNKELLGGNQGSVITNDMVYGASSTIIRNSLFEGNTGGLGVIVNVSGAVTLNGCITFTNNTPANMAGSESITDNTSGSCSDADLIPPTKGNLTTSPGAASSVTMSECFQQLGAIGWLCRIPGAEHQIHVYEVNSDNMGVFKLAVRQSQVDAVQPPAALVACSGDGRVAVRVWADRNITIYMGPNWEGKIHSVLLQGSLDGPVIGTVDTYGNQPC